MKRLALALALGLVLAACSGAAADEPAAPVTSSTAVPSTTVATTTTTTPPTTTTTTTTVPPTTTTTTEPPTPAELRAAFLDDLDNTGWVTYTDEVVGWSIRYPADWVVMEETPGERLTVMTPQQKAFFLISPSLDATADDESSEDYVAGNVEFSVEEGLLREPSSNSEFWLDADFDGRYDPQDIYGFELSLAIDLETGEPLSDEQLAPVVWIGYYDPDARPGYGYVMQTIGVDPILYRDLDDIILSFEPPDGYPLEA